MSYTWASFAEEFHSSFCSSLISGKLLVAAINFFLPLLPMQTELPTPCQNTFLVPAQIFFFTSTIFPGPRISFLPSESLYLSHPQDEKNSLLTCYFCDLSYPLYLKLFDHMILSFLLFFLESSSIFSCHQTTLSSLLWIKLFIILSRFRMGLTNPNHSLK